MTTTEESLYPDVGTRRGRVLLADDEESFLLSTADLLRLDGYEVVTSTDGEGAADVVEREELDVVVADIRMAGNGDLQLVKRVAGLPLPPAVILLTGYPSLRTAIPAIHLSVSAYLIKPIDHELLTRHLEDAVERTNVARRARQLAARTRQWSEELEALSRNTLASADAPANAGIDGFAELAVANIIASVGDLHRIARAAAPSASAPNAVTPCVVMNCPRYRILTSAIEDAVSVLELTKRSFKSRALAELKERLQLALGDARRPADRPASG